MQREGRQYANEIDGRGTRTRPKTGITPWEAQPWENHSPAVRRRQPRWKPRRFGSIKVAADVAALSRLYAGIHFRSGVLGGQVQGHCVAQRVLGLKIRG